MDIDTEHDENVYSIDFRVDGAANLDDIKTWFAELLWERSILPDAQFYRFKGSIAVAGEEEKYMLQGVHENFDLQASGIKWEGPSRESHFVFIGKKLSKDKLRESFVKLCLKEK
jgi:G3E family GTPase